MNYLKKLLMISVVLSFSILLGCGKKDSKNTTSKTYTMKIAHGDPDGENSAYQILANKFKQIVESKTNLIKIEIFPSNQLSSEQRAFQDVQNGIVEAAVIASNNASVFSPTLTILDLPFLFNSTQEFSTVINKLGDKYSKVVIEESNVRPIAWGVQGFRVLGNSKKEIKTINDLSGIKIRVPSNPLQIEAFKSWNSEPIGMAFDELFSALQQKVVDGLEATYIALSTQKMSEVIKYVSDLRYKLAINPLVISEEWFKNLPKDLQIIIIESGKEATIFAINESSRLEETGKQDLKKEGVILTGTFEDENIWKAKAKATWPKFYPIIKNKKLLEETLSLLNQNSN